MGRWSGRKREKILNGPTGDKRFEDEGGRESSISRQRARLYNGCIHLGRARVESHSRGRSSKSESCQEF